MIDGNSPLSDLRAHFLATSTSSMPVAGMIFWAVVGVAGLLLAKPLVAYIVLFGSGMIFPLAILIDKATGKNKIKVANTANPILQLFLRSIVMIALLWPLVIIAAKVSGRVDLVVLGGAILMGIIWIPYGWGTDDRSGMEHAVGRAVACYAAYLFVPEPYKISAIAAAVLLSYLYSFLRMKRPPA